MESTLALTGVSLARALGWMTDLCEPTEHPPTRLRSGYARAVADRVLAASDLSELHDLIEEASLDNQLWNSEAPAQSMRPEELARHIELSKLDMPSLTKVLGSGAAGICNEGHQKLLAATQKVVEAIRLLREMKALAAVDEALKKREPVSDAKIDVVRFLDDVKIPVAARREYAALLRKGVAQAAICRAEEHGEKLAGWLALALADEYADMPRRFMDAYGALTVPQFLGAAIAALASWLEKHRAVEATMGEWANRAEEPSEGLFAPFADADVR